MSKSRERQFKELDKLIDNLDPLRAEALDLIIKTHGEQLGRLEVREVIYRLATEVAFLRKKRQLGYVQ